MMHARFAALWAAATLTACANLPGVYDRKAAEPPASAAPAPAAGATAPVAGATAPAATTAPAQAPAVATLGQLAPDVALTAIDGGRRRLSEFKGKFLALVFFAHW